MTCTLDDLILDEDSSRIIADAPLCNGADDENGSIPLFQPNPSRSKPMFVNERFVDDDTYWGKYGVPAIERRVFEFTRPSTCTIDHERNIYLLHVATQKNPDYDHVSTGLHGWFFFWRGYELWVELKRMEAKGEYGGSCWSRHCITKLCLMSEKDDWMGRSTRGLPPGLKARQEEILKDFHDALVVYKKAASKHTTYELTLELAEGV
jgi:hypothetical protein